MEVKELNEALEGLKQQVSESTAENKKELKGQIKDLEQKMNEAFAKGLEEATAQQAKEFKKLEEELEQVKDHAAKLDVKLHSPENQKGNKTPTYGQMMRKMIADKFETIKNVGHSSTKENFDTKAVGNMTLGTNLTGDQPRDYSMEVAMVPGQKLNFADLVSTITIEGGTYTYPRETTSEGAIAMQIEGDEKSQIDYDLEMIDVSTDFLAGTTTYSKKMRNNLPFLQSFIPRALRRDYFKAENSKFSTELAAFAQASTVIEGNEVERLVSEIGAIEDRDYAAGGIVIRPSDYWKIIITEKTGAGYSLPGIVTMEGGQLRIGGIPIYKATWIDANKYFVGDWSYVQKIVTEGLSLEFSTENKDNFVKNNITAKIEAQIALAVERPDAIVFGDFTTTA